MKQFRSFATCIVASMTMFLFSCGSANEKTANATKDTSQTNTEQKVPETTAPAKPVNIVVIKHKVADFAKWKMGYDAHDSARRANGLTRYFISRGLGSDSNTVLVVLNTNNIIKAKEFASSSDLKEAMEKSGVKGSPTMIYDELVWDDNSKIDQTNRLMVTHKVKDFDVWKKEFDSHKQARIDAGLIDRGVAHAAGDSHLVTLVFAVTDMAKAKAFIVSKDLKDKMAAAGVEGPPTFFFYNIVQMYQ